MRKSCRYTSYVEQCFDGHAEETEQLRRHIEGCPACKGTLATLSLLRNACPKPDPAEVNAAQFPAFYRGIMEGVSAPQRRYGRVLTALSLAAAALIVAVSCFVIFTELTEGPARVDATVVESCSSELEGATVTTYDDSKGEVTTVWVTVAREDVW
jgi:anti-sigma factor RsiW